MNPNKILALIALIPSLSMANQALLVPDGKWIKTSDNNEKIVISTNQKQVTFGDNKCPWAKSASETMKSDCVAVKQEPLEKSSIQNNLNQLEKSITEGVRKKLYDRQTAADLKKLAEKTERCSNPFQKIKNSQNSPSTGKMMMEVIASNPISQSTTKCTTKAHASVVATTVTGSRH